MPTELPPRKTEYPTQCLRQVDRRKTRKYQKKKRIVRDLWLFSGVIMLCIPVALIAVLALGTTFASFMILDETP